MGTRLHMTTSGKLNISTSSAISTDYPDVTNPSFHHHTLVDKTLKTLAITPSTSLSIFQGL